MGWGVGPRRQKPDDECMDAGDAGTVAHLRDISPTPRNLGYPAGRPQSNLVSWGYPVRKTRNLGYPFGEFVAGVAHWTSPPDPRNLG